MSNDQMPDGFGTVLLKKTQNGRLPFPLCFLRHSKEQMTITEKILEIKKVSFPCLPAVFHSSDNSRARLTDVTSVTTGSRPLGLLFYLSLAVLSGGLTFGIHKGLEKQGDAMANDQNTMLMQLGIIFACLVILANVMCKPLAVMFGVRGNQPFNLFNITVDQGDLEEYEIMQIVLEAQDYTKHAGKRGVGF